MDEQIRNLAVYALPILFAITMHDAVQAFAARHFGDMSGHAAGRTSFNPLNHIDPLGTIVVPAVMYLFTGFVVGYAKPLPIDYGQMRNPKRDMAWVALSGPLANFLMALGWMLLAILLQYFQVDERFPNMVARAGVLTNIWLMAFNLLPILPLDGGKVVFSLLPHKAAFNYARLEPYGMFIVLGLMFLNVLGIWLALVASVANGLMGVILSPLTHFLH